MELRFFKCFVGEAWHVRSATRSASGTFHLGNYFRLKPQKRLDLDPPDELQGVTLEMISCGTNVVEETVSVADDISNWSGLTRSTSPLSRFVPPVSVRVRFPCGFEKPLGATGGVSAHVPESVVIGPVEG